LLNLIKAAINEGRITTWAYDADGDFIHTPAQWKGKGWLRPSQHLGALVMMFLPPNSGEEPEARGVYLGRFAEMLVNHFANSVTSIDLP
jgi:hypothetical protein